MPRCPCGSKVAPEGMDDIVRDRKCTDLLWLVFFAFFWVGMLVIAIIGMQNGNPAKFCTEKITQTLSARAPRSTYITPV